MPRTKLTLPMLKNHWQYGKWIYIAIAVGAYFMGSMAFTMTEYRPPAERKVDFQIVGIMGDMEPVSRSASSLLADAQTFDPTLEEISAYNIMYSGDPETDIYGAQKYTVMIAAGEGAVYMLPRDLMLSLVEQGGLLPLDSYIDGGTLDVTGLDLESVTLEQPQTNEEEPLTGEAHVYALPCSSLMRFMDPDIALDVSDMYMVIMSYCKNPDTAAYTMQQFRVAMTESRSSAAESSPMPSAQDAQ